MDELFEAITLVQTGKVTSFPLVLMGTQFWTPLVDWIRGTLLGSGKISAGDLDLMTVTDDPAEVIEVILAADRRRKEAMAEGAESDRMRPERGASGVQDPW